MAIIIQHRRGPAADWTSANPVLADGEMGVETDTLKVKIGNGTSNWVSLPYFTQGATGLSAYQVALAEGFVGTQSQWIASLEGDVGPTGATGATGGFNAGSNNTIDLWASQGSGGAYSEPLSIKAFQYSGQNKISCRNEYDGLIMYVTDTGNVRGMGAYTNLSDRNSKENIVYVDKQVLADAVNFIKPASFNYIGGTEKHLGFIAQDVQEVLPDAVKQFDDTRLGLDTNVIIAALVAKCQDLEARLAALEAK